MKRTGIILLTIAVALLAVAPAASAKKPAPEDSPSYTVDITFVGEHGVATTCPDDEGFLLTWEVTRTDERRGARHFESYAGAPLEIAADIAWDDEPLTGCHGNLVPPEYFRITLNDDSTVAMLWIFDVEYAEKIVPSKNGKTKVKTVRTDFRMGGPYNSDGGFATTEVSEINGSLVFSATGTFSFVHYNSNSNPLMVNLVNSPQQFELVVTLTPN